MIQYLKGRSSCQQSGYMGSNSCRTIHDNTKWICISLASYLDVKCKLLSVSVQEDTLLW